eukprot:TRINITY_DN4643_c0_g1_i1.p1 TRINITY_DN4643_c0_g1~~TRINITY_DN4643_c0_g1_i1.p1  ORF type:complete len:121 (-),score=31.96 TRINITY_DN4643_c0_g1_i1:127-462(-)
MAYAAGLALTYVALLLMNGAGQPALLYIVPCTLGVVIFLGWRRNELMLLWTKGEEERQKQSSNGDTLDEDHICEERGTNSDFSFGHSIDSQVVGRAPSNCRDREIAYEQVP